jgi:ABC-type nitrate/sulfonate/bicarbonate transport system permease component
MTATVDVEAAEEVPAAGRRKGRGDHRQRLVGAAALALGLLGWELYGQAQDSNLFVPTVTQMLGALFGLFQDPEFWSSYRETLEPFLLGWSTSVVAGVVLGLAIGRSVVLQKMASPHLSFLNALPMSTMVPIIVIAFGIGITARATTVFLFAFVEVILTTIAGTRYISQDLLEMSRSFGMSRARRFQRVILPGAMPGIAAAIRVGTGRSIIGMVVMELLLVSVGVGKLISRYKDGFRSAELYAVVFSLAVFGLVMLALVRRLEKRLLRWRSGGEMT